MKKLMFASLTGWLLTASIAFGVYDPTWERPILGAYDMEVSDVRFSFNDVEKADLVLTKRDGEKQATGMIVSLVENGVARDVTLVVNQVEVDGCNSTVYFASLPATDKMGARFSVVLEDHTARVCDDIKPFIWEASVREGYGWCGTMDSTMLLAGDPEAIITIQSLP